MIFEKTFSAVSELDLSIRTAQGVLRSEKEKINATYKGQAMEKKLSEAKAMHEKEMIAQRQKAYDTVIADIADARRSVSETISAAVPADFPATLAALKAKGGYISDYEGRIFLEKFKGNYLAFSALVDVLHGEKKALDVFLVKPDTIEEKITLLENLVLDWIQANEYDSWTAAFLTDEAYTPILKDGALVQSFIDGKFAHSGYEDSAFKVNSTAI